MNTIAELPTSLTPAEARRWLLGYLQHSGPLRMCDLPATPAGAAIQHAADALTLAGVVRWSSPDVVRL